MSTATIQQSDIYTAMPDNSLTDYFRKAGDMFAAESAVLGTAIRQVLLSDEHINNKNIILALLRTLEATRDVVQADVIRKTLEIVVGHTTDDI
ncbi:biofilm development regulator YmgB/AriR family protein [Scandinavium goeteborgense]|uniref:Biofilm development protein YmgB/AriR n=1 Tax=Scandinavium goeteborgense TaxID=1851514 RepID=A0A4R6EFN5_SCAGO|nr:biofilm development regulator YmgB/AriR family protein [Scandinavium goeteborgense]TDN56613.1 biofilm development protein YmgB/AriR [Scandinavium goeteborgense]